MRGTTKLNVAGFSAAALLACAGGTPAQLGVHGAELAPCPSSPNCVSSDAAAGPQHVEALRFAGDPDAAWRRARAAVESLPRTTVESDAEGRLHAVCTSALMRYRDDLELRLDAERLEIAVRSASRVGYGDMGVNRARVEAVRAAFEAAPR